MMMEMLKCERCCDGPCARSVNIDDSCIGTTPSGEDWKMVNMVEVPEHEGMAINPDNLEFGDDVEVLFDLEYRLASWCGVLGMSRNRAAVLVSDVVWTFPLKHIRFPLKKMIRKGQPLIVGTYGHVRLFAKLESNRVRFFSDKTDLTAVCDTWRLPTKKELREIGQDGLGWLTSD